MSFIHRNRVWLLPLLGLGCAWGVWNTVSTVTGKPKPKPADATPAPTHPSDPVSIAATPSPAPFSPSGGVTPSQPPPPAFGSAGGAPPQQRSDPNDELWADLRALEKAPAALSQTDALLKEGEQPLAVKWLTPVAPPNLSKEIWKYLFDRVQEKIEKISSKKLAVSKPIKLPKLDFVIFHGSPVIGEAWFEGQPYHVGEILQGYYTVKRISQQKVTLITPEGELNLETREKFMEETT